MVTALRSGPFADSLYNKPAMDMNEMRVRASKFMRLEELRDFGGADEDGVPNPLLPLPAGQNSN